MPTAPLEPTQLLHYLPQHRVLICTGCRYAIQPSAISRHLKEIHRIYRSNRREFMNYAEELDLADPKNVTLPGPNEDPLPFLPTTNGLSCEASGCNYLCASIKRMKMHWAAEHSEMIADDSQWRPVDLQTFFRGNQLRYFIVRQSSTTLSRPERHSNIDSETTNPRTVTPPLLLTCDPHVMTIEDLKLLEHFKTSTCLEIGYDATIRHVWHTDVPVLAAKHPFLKHGVLACSALHLAFLHPSERQRYQLIAAHHQNIALPQFRFEIGNPNIDNCFALLAFTQLLIIHCFSADQHDEELLLVKGRHDLHLPDWLHVIRASCHIFQSVWPYIQSLPIVALVTEGLEREGGDQGFEPSKYDERLRGLFELIKPNTAQTAQKLLDCYFSPLSSALLILSRAFAKAQAAQSRNAYTLWVATHTWPVQVTQEYLDLLRGRDPVALILLAHYCILLRPLEDNWYMSGYSKRLLTRIYNQLDEEWRPWLRWPLEEIGP